MIYALLVIVRSHTKEQHLRRTRGGIDRIELITHKQVDAEEEQRQQQEQETTQVVAIRKVLSYHISS